MALMSSVLFSLSANGFSFNIKIVFPDTKIPIFMKRPSWVCLAGLLVNYGISTVCH